MKIEKIVFLGSGGGGNLKVASEYFKEFPVMKVCGVLADRKCGAVEYAVKENIIHRKLSFERNNKGSAELIQVIQDLDPDVIITNVHKILSTKVVNEFSGKLVNLHYSYLPAYGGTIGMKPVDLAIERNNSFIGTTSHFVTEEVDAGKIISQGIFDRYKVENVYQKTFETGALTLLSTLYHLKYGDIDSRAFGSSMISPSSNKIDEEFLKIIFERLKS